MSKICLITGANAMDSKELTHIHLSRGNSVILTYRRTTTFDVENIRKTNINNAIDKNLYTNFILAPYYSKFYHVSFI